MGPAASPGPGTLHLARSEEALAQGVRAGPLPDSEGLLGTRDDLHEPGFPSPLSLDHIHHPLCRTGYRLAGGNIWHCSAREPPNLAGFLGPDSPLALTLLGCIKEALVVVGGEGQGGCGGLIQEGPQGIMSGRVAGRGRVEVPLPSFLPLVICSEPGRDGPRGSPDLFRSGCFSSQTLLDMEPGEHILSYHRFWVLAPVLHLRTVLSSSW